MWQDIVFGIGNGVFALALVPTIRGREKPARLTCAGTVIALCGFVVAQISLALWLTAAVTVLEAALWTVLWRQVGGRERT